MKTSSTLDNLFTILAHNTPLEQEWKKHCKQSSALSRPREINPVVVTLEPRIDPKDEYADGIVIPAIDAHHSSFQNRFSIYQDAPLSTWEMRA